MASKAVSFATNGLLDVPKGVSGTTYRAVVTAASIAYTQKRDVPTVDEIARLCTCKPATISRVISTPEFKALMAARGFAFNAGGKLTAEQYHAISVITDASNRKPLSAKLKSAGVTYAQYRAWLKQPHFRDYISKVAEDMLGEHVADVHTRVVEKATNGDINAIKLYYELTGRHDPNKQQMVQLQGIVGLLLEIITRYVPDTVVLGKITADIDMVMQGGDVHAIDQFDLQRIAASPDETNFDIEDALVVEEPPIGDFFDEDH